MSDQHEAKEPSQVSFQADDPYDRAVSAGVPDYYFNQYNNSLGSGDITMTLMRNGYPVATLHTSYTVAKTMADSLQHLIGVLEEATDNKIMTTHEVGDKLSVYTQENTHEEPQ